MLQSFRYISQLLIPAILFSCSANTSRKDTEKVDAANTVNFQNKEAQVKADTTPADQKILQLTRTYHFGDYEVPVYTGKPAVPDFRGNPFARDPEYIKFITKGCKDNPVNFGGHYTILLRGCGAECLHFFIVDRISGRIFTDVKPDDGRYGYAFRPNSNLLIANASLFVDEQFEKYTDYWCKPEFYTWVKDKFVMKK